jgi:hypothetical protein
MAGDVGSYSAAGLESIASGGGYDPGQLASITGGYQSFADTGGFTPQQSTDYINAATSGVTGTYNTLMGQQQRQRAAQGLGAGGGEYQSLARDLTTAQDQADLNARANLAQQTNANKLAGLGGLTSVNQSRVSNELAANQGLNQLYNTATNQVTAMGQQLLSALGLQFGTQQEAISFLTQLSKNPGLFQTIMGDIGSIGGAAAGVMGGIGGLLPTGNPAAPSAPTAV